MMVAAGLPESLVRASTIHALVDAAAASPAGALAEFGVYKGGTAVWLSEVAKRQGRALWLFDTFTGIPYADAVDYHKVGDFGDVSLDAVRAAVPGAHIVVGEFPESIFGLELPRFAFVHVDADQYRSVKAACEVFAPLMVPGGVIWFDDYLCRTTPGATQAVDECFPGRVEPVAGRGLVRFP